MVSTEDWIAELRATWRRPAAVARVLDGRQSDDPARSWLGQVSMIGRGEEWPTFEGRPMAGLAQLNLTEARYVPDELRGIAMINVWLAGNEDGLILPDERPNGDGWAVRAYAALGDLVSTQGNVLGWVRPHQLEWELIDDYPDWDDIVDSLDDDQTDTLLDDDEAMDALGHAADGTKLGGWPSLVQHELSWAHRYEQAEPQYCFQIDSDENVKLNLWDRGVLHIGIASDDGAPIWVAETQFM